MSAAKPSFSFYVKCACLIFVSVILLVNMVHLAGQLKRIAKVKRVVAFNFPGIKFAGLETFFKNTDRVGYYTDRDIKADDNAALFAQAQLVLAPAVLDLNNLTHRYTIFDCADEQHALNKIMEMGARPIKKKGALILAERPQ